MRLQKGKWYVCLKSWSDDGWTKFYKGDLVFCEKDNEVRDCYGFPHTNNEKEQLFREATEVECNIAKATEVDMKEFMEDVRTFSHEDKLIDIYRSGAEAMLIHIRANLSIKD